MIQKIKSLFLKKTKDKQTIEKDSFQKCHSVNILGNSYFAVKNINLNDIVLRLKVAELNFEKCNQAFEFLWTNNFGISEKNNSEIKIIISETIQNWNFIYWSCGIFEECKNIVEKLNIDINCKVNYYYADSCVDGYEWIIAENGIIKRQFEYSMGTISTDIGSKICLIENEFIKNIELENQNLKNEFIFGENVFEAIIQETCDFKDKYFDKNIRFKVGTIKI